MDSAGRAGVRRRARGTRPVLASLSLVLLLGAGACSSTDEGMTRSKAKTAVTAGTADAAERLGTTWGPPRSRRTVDPDIAQRCGSPRTGLDAPSDGLLASGTSPVLSHDLSSSRSSPKGYGEVRTAVLAYEDVAAAKAAFATLGADALEACLVTVVNGWLDAQGSFYESFPRSTADSFDTTSAPFAAGDQASLTGTKFEEEVIGGFDNWHNGALFVGRSGPLVVTAIAASNTQGSDPRNPASLARRLGTAALDRATAA